MDTIAVIRARLGSGDVRLAAGAGCLLFGNRAVGELAGSLGVGDGSR